MPVLEFLTEMTEYLFGKPSEVLKFPHNHNAEPDKPEESGQRDGDQ